MLIVALMSSSYRRRYKSVVALAALLGAFSLALAFVLAIGTPQSLNALVLGGKSKTKQVLVNVGTGVTGEVVTIERASSLDKAQAGIAAASTIFFTVMGILYAKRQPDTRAIW
jgi:hypothetical protein